MWNQGVASVYANVAPGHGQSKGRRKKVRVNAGPKVDVEGTWQKPVEYSYGCMEGMGKGRNANYIELLTVSTQQLNVDPEAGAKRPGSWRQATSAIVHHKADEQIKVAAWRLAIPHINKEGEALVKTFKHLPDSLSANNTGNKDQMVPVGAIEVLSKE